MTLATVPRYDPDRSIEAGERAVVVGAGIAGLCAARVLADGFRTVTVIDRDPLPDEPTVDIAWNMAVGNDHQFPQTRGPKPRGTDLLNWYLSRYIRQAHTDGELWDDFFGVQMMERPPSTLFSPGNVWRVFAPTG